MEFKPPANLSLHGNLSENWRKFKQNFEIYLKASDKSGKEDEIKIAILLNIIGEECVEVYNTFALSDTERRSFQSVLKAFEDHCSPKKNIVFERFKFYSRLQQEAEGFDQFLTDVKKLSQSCEFGTLCDEMVRDRIVLGIYDKAIQERLLRVEDLNLTKAVNLCRAAEISKSQARNLQGLSVDVESVKKRSVNHNNYNKSALNSSGAEKKNFNKGRQSGEKFKCRRCQTLHGVRECPAFGKKCSKCGQLNHFAVSCRVKNIRVLQEQDEESDEGEFAINVIGIRNQSDKVLSINSWFQSVNIGDHQVPIKFKLDTGADVNVLSRKMLSEVGIPESQLRDTKIVLEAFGGSVLKPLGVVPLKVQCNNVEFTTDFIIVDKAVSPLLGLESCIKLNLIVLHKEKIHNLYKFNTKDEFIKKNSELFEGLGKFRDKCEIQVNSEAIPVINPPRRIPFAIRNKLKETLISLEHRKIISKVEKPSGWVNNIVIVEKKDGSLRICLDPQDLNLEIKRPAYVLIPTLEDIVEKLKGKKFFTVLDLKEGFWHVELTEKSSNLCTFATHFGCYKFNRMPFGLNMAPEYFQAINQKIFGDLKGVQVYIDDLLIAADSSEEHDQILNSVLKRAIANGVKFNPNKVQFKQSSVNYFGHVFSAEGMFIDANRIAAIKGIKYPKNVKELQSILGMINFLRQFIPNLADITAPLRELLKSKVEFKWLTAHSVVLDNIKNIICNAPVLANFDASKSITIQSDASKDGLGCCLLQDDKPISFASRSLNSSEKNYSQIEKELLSIVFAVKKFHNFIYGREINVNTDHKPLVTLMNKKIGDIASSRLQRMRIKLLKYKLALNYLPGKYMFIADLLSRSYLNVQESEGDDKWISETVHTLSKNFNISDDKRIEFKQATASDPVLSRVMLYILNGWPKNNELMEGSIRYFDKFQADLCVEDGLVFVNHRLVVPDKLRSYILRLLHEPHFGVVKTKQRARQVVFWPGMSSDIQSMISNCYVCERYQNSKQNDVLMPHEIPNVPFHKIACDIMDYAGNSYLIVQDYFSKWLEIILLKNKTSSEIIRHLKVLFATFGIPKTVVCDNMPFLSYECKNFSKDWNFEFCTSSPKYPRSNGQAERAVQTAKLMFKKCSYDNVDIHLALLEFRNTPVSGIGISPTQMLMNRLTRTKLPIHTELLRPVIPIDAHNKLVAKQEYYKSNHDKNAKKFYQNLKPGDNVLIKDTSWEKGQVVVNHSAPRSFNVMNNNGNVIRRNFSQLKPTNTKFELNNSSNDLPDVLYQTKINDQSSSSGNTPDSSLLENSTSNNQNNVQVDFKKEPTTDSTVNQRIVRSGRIVQLPTKFKDYVM